MSPLQYCRIRLSCGEIAIVSMAFIDWPGGGDGFNVKNDPSRGRLFSTQTFRAGHRQRRGGAQRDFETDPSRGTCVDAVAWLCRRGIRDGLFDDFLTQQADLVARLGTPGTWAIWDEVVVAYLLGLARVNEVPRPHLESDLSFSHPETARRLSWLTEIDTERLWLDFTGKIDARGARK